MLKYAGFGLLSFIVSACSLAPEAPQNGDGDNCIGVGACAEAADSDDTGDTDTHTGETGDSDTDSGIDTADSGDTGDTAIDTGETGTVDTGDTDSGTDTADSGDSGDTGDTALDTGGETGIVDTAGDTAEDTGLDSGGDTATDTGETGTVDTGGADTATDTAADTAVGDTGDSGILVTDVDGDGYDDVVYGGSDCDDTDATVNPGATEVFNDGVDQDCDGSDVDWIDVEVDTTRSDVGEMWIYYGAGRDESGYSFPYQFTLAVSWLGERALNAEFDPDGDGNVSATGSIWTDYDTFVADQAAGEDVSNYVLLATDDELSELASDGVDTTGFTALGGQATWFQVSAWDTTGAWMSLNVTEWSFATDSWAFARAFDDGGNLIVQVVGNNWDYHASGAGVFVTP